jgi:hypothetical protein
LIFAICRVDVETFPTGIYYEQGKEPPPEGPPKLHLLIESNEEFRVRVLLTLSGVPHMLITTSRRLNKRSEK